METLIRIKQPCSWCEGTGRTEGGYVACNQCYGKGYTKEWINIGQLKKLLNQSK